MLVINNIMDMKRLIILLTVILAIAKCEGKAALRRKPKVYNALITTDEDLVQSRAYPVIQPTIHESGIAHLGPYDPFGVYNPHVVRLAQPIAPALASKQQLTYSLPPSQFPPQFMQQPLIPQPQTVAGYAIAKDPPTAPAAEKPQESASAPPTDLKEQTQLSIQPPTMPMQSAEIPKDPNQLSKMPSEQLPIPLNQYGLPPALIPLRQPQPYQHFPYPPPLNTLPQPYHLPPYRFNQIPPIYYNNFPGLRQPFLPSYDYLPTGPQFPLSNTIPTDKTYPQPDNPPAPLPTSVAPVTSALIEQTTESLPPSEPQPSFENIKNGSKSKDNNVPDVPPPPIPSGAKSEQS